MNYKVRKLVSVMIAFIMLLGLIPAQAVLAADSPAAEDMIDYSHPVLGGYGYTFGVINNETRWQTFTATRNGEMQSIEVVLLKKNAATVATPDVTAYLYSVQDGMPSAELARVTLLGEQVKSATSGATVDDSMITVFPLSYKLNADEQYAIVLESAVVGTDGGKDQCYDWYTAKNIAPDEHFGKSDTGVWKDESGLGTGWLRITYAPLGADVIDYSFEGSGNGYGFGATGNEYRFQTFTATKSGEMDSVDVKVTKFAHDQESGLDEIGDLRIELRSVVDGLPAEKLTEVVVPVSEIESKAEKNVSFSYPLEAGEQYAIAMIMAGTLSKHGGFDCYGWTTSGSGAAVAGEHFGKTNTTTDPNYAGEDYNWVHEDHLGTGWLRVNYKKAVTPSVPTKIVWDIDKTLLNVGEVIEYSAVVQDQYGAPIADAEIQVASGDESVIRVNVEAHTLEGLKGGSSQITFSSGAISATVTLSVQHTDGTVIPTPGMVITQDTVFAPGDYDFNGATKGITIAADNITLNGNGARIRNAPAITERSDVTSGAYAYQLNYKEGHDKYFIARKLQLDSANIIFSFDYKGYLDENHILSVEVSEDGGQSWQSMLDQSTGVAEWEKASVDLSAYAGKSILLRTGYIVAEENGQEEMKLDTFELFEDGVRTFSDLAEAKIFYWWDVSYEDGVRVADDLKDKPFDRTTYTISPNLFKGTGLAMDGVKGVTVQNLDLSGFFWAVDVKNSSDITLENNTFSNNRTDPNGGWGDQEGGAVQLTNVDHSTIVNNTATNNANGLVLRNSDNNAIKENNFSVNSDVCLEMHTSSFNDIQDNDFSWGIRIDAYEEVHARDSTSQLMESGSNYNLFKNNDFTHGGDGIFIRVLNGWSCEGNWFEGNDTSYANNNAVESWAGRNYYINNKANHSSYGFWLGGSDESVLRGNEAAYNGIMPHNAPEAFGNAGIAIVNGTGEHIRLVENNIHHNYGPGIALRYRAGYPTHHYVIAGNRIENNVTSPYSGSHRGYAIYLDQGDWFDISNNLIQGNSYDSVYKSATVTNVFERGGSYENFAASPTAVISADRSQFVVGETVTFTAQGSSDPNGKNLFYRWNMGDGTIKVGQTVTHVFEKTGYHGVAFTVSNGSESDLAWMNCNVVAPGIELGTEDDVSNWLIPDQGGKTVASVETLVKDKPVDWLDYDVYYVVDGEKSIKIDSTSSANSMTYPKGKNASWDFSEESALTFSIKVQNAGNDWATYKTPVVRLYTDDANYIQYTPVKSWLSPVYAADYGCGQNRSDWIGLVVPFTGNSEWSVRTTGTVDFANINYVSFDMATGGSGLHLWLDGLKTIPASATPEYAVSMSWDATVTASSSAQGSDPSTPLYTLDKTKYWQSGTEETVTYTMDFGTDRYINRTDLYLYYSPTGNPDVDTIGLPSEYLLEYLNGEEWMPVEMNGATSLKTDGNLLNFKMVKTNQLRFTFTNQPGLAVALYGLQVFNTNNYVAKTDAEGSLDTLITSSIVKNAVLDTVEMMININNASYWDTPGCYGDFEAYLYKASVDGKGPIGVPLAKGVVPKSEIKPADFGQPRTIEMRDAQGEKIVLLPGEQYVLLATQNPVTTETGEPSGNLHYRWPTSNSLGIAGEQFGKVNATDISNITSFAPENLGVGWMKVHTDQDKNGKATVDYSWDIAQAKTGFGVGHQGEENRYQTFTMPADTVLDVADGQVNNGKGWSTQESDAQENAIIINFTKQRTVGFINVHFAQDHVPAEMKVISNGSQILSRSDLVAGFNGFNVDLIDTDNLEFVFTNGDSYVVVQQIEVMESGLEEGSIVDPVDKSALEALIGTVNALVEEDYTAESWSDLADALAKAEAVLADEDAKQDAVNSAYDDLDTAIKALETIGGGEDIPVTKVKINASGLFTLSVKKKAQIPVTVEPEDATDPSVQWISTNTNIFTVDEDGNITPHKQGTATLTAQSSNGLKSTIIVRITA